MIVCDPSGFDKSKLIKTANGPELLCKVTFSSTASRWATRKRACLNLRVVFMNADQIVEDCVQEEFFGNRQVRSDRAKHFLSEIVGHETAVFPIKKGWAIQIAQPFFIYRYMHLPPHAFSNVGGLSRHADTLAEHASHTLNDDGSALADTNTHGAQGIFAAGALQLIHGSRYQTRT